MDEAPTSCRQAVATVRLPSRARRSARQSEQRYLGLVATEARRLGREAQTALTATDATRRELQRVRNRLGTPRAWWEDLHGTTSDVIAQQGPRDPVGDGWRAAPRGGGRMDAGLPGLS